MASRPGGDSRLEKGMVCRAASLTLLLRFESTSDSGGCTGILSWCSESLSAMSHRIRYSGLWISGWTFVFGITHHSCISSRATPPATGWNCITTAEKITDWEELKPFRMDGPRFGSTPLLLPQHIPPRFFLFLRPPPLPYLSPPRRRVGGLIASNVSCPAESSEGFRRLAPPFSATLSPTGHCRPLPTSPTKYGLLGWCFGFYV